MRNNSIHISDLRPLLIAHFFRRASSHKDLIKRFGAIQIDPVSIVDTNQSLVFAARNTSLSQSHLNCLYERQEVIETYAKERCVVLARDAPLYWPLICNRRIKRKDLLEKYRKELGTIRQLFHKHGSLSPLELESPKVSRQNGWGPRKLNTLLMHLLWETGEIGVAKRQGRNITYRILPKHLWRLSADKRQNPRLLREIRWRRYVDSVVLTDARDTFCGFESCPARDRRNALRILVESGGAIPITGLDDASYPVVSTQILNTHSSRNEVELPCFIPPLDNFLWHRLLVNDIWDFHYRWEIYVPPSERKHGPFAMPLVTSEGLFGPVDFRFDRESRCLTGRLSSSPLKTTHSSVRAAAEIAAQKLASALSADQVKLV